MTVPRSFRVRTYHLLISVIPILMLILLFSACGDEAEIADEPEPTATPEPTEEFEPERIFSVQVSDEHSVQHVEFDPEGSMIAAGTYMRVVLLDVSNGENVGEIEHRHSVEKLEFSPDGSLIAGGQSTYGVQISDVESRSLVSELHSGYNNVLAFSPDGNTIASGNRAGDVWTWDVDSGEQLNEMSPEENEWLSSLTYSPDGSIIASGHWDGGVHIWNATTGDLIETFANPEGFGHAYDLAFSPDGEQLAVAGARDGSDNAVRMWRIEDDTELTSVSFDNETRSVDFSSDGEQLVVGSDDGVHIMSAADWSMLFQIQLDKEPGESNWVTSVRFAPDDQAIAVGYWDGHVELWQVRP